MHGASQQGFGTQEAYNRRLEGSTGQDNQGQGVFEGSERTVLRFLPQSQIYRRSERFQQMGRKRGQCRRQVHLLHREIPLAGRGHTVHTG